MDKIPFSDLASQLADYLAEILKRYVKMTLKEQLITAKEHDLEQWETQKEEELRQIEAKSTPFAILKNIPPPMSHKGKNESFPIVRFTYKKEHNWYQAFITHYTDLCRVLRLIHSSEATSEALQIQIAAVVNYKNFPAKDYEDLRNRVRKLVVMLKDINRQCSQPEILEHINFFENLTFPYTELLEAYEANEEEQQAEEDSSSGTG